MPVFAQTDDLPDRQLRQVALLAATPEELTRDHGIEFHEAEDDLGAFVWAAGDVDGEPFVLMRYERSPEAGTVLFGAQTAEPFADALDLPDQWRPEA